MEKDQPDLNTVIRTFANEVEAHVAQAVLDANGIDSYLIRDDAKRPPFFGTLSHARAFPHTALPHASLVQRWDKANQVFPGLSGPYKAAGVYADGVPLHP